MLKRWAWRVQPETSLTGDNDDWNSALIRLDFPAPVLPIKPMMGE